MNRLKDKTAIVTGGASGIGQATAQLFAQEGARVVIADCDGKGAEVAAGIERDYGPASFVRVDVSEPDEVRDLVDQVVGLHGRLDILVSNAGIEGVEASVAECSPENFDRVMAVNVRGVFLTMKYAIPALIRFGGGAIVNVSSVGGIAARAGLAAYCASKAAVIQLTKAAALEYGSHGIRINAVCPSAVWTPMMERFLAEHEGLRSELQSARPIDRYAEPIEIARMILFLASDEASFCTGAPFIADGGFLAG